MPISRTSGGAGVDGPPAVDASTWGLWQFTEDDDAVSWPNHGGGAALPLVRADSAGTPLPGASQRGRPSLFRNKRYPSYCNYGYSEIGLRGTNAGAPPTDNDWCFEVYFRPLPTTATPVPEKTIFGYRATVGAPAVIAPNDWSFLFYLPTNTLSPPTWDWGVTVTLDNGASWGKTISGSFGNGGRLLTGVNHHLAVVVYQIAGTTRATLYLNGVELVDEVIAASARRVLFNANREVILQAGYPLVLASYGLVAAARMSNTRRDVKYIIDAARRSM